MTSIIKSSLFFSLVVVAFSILTFTPVVLDNLADSANGVSMAQAFDGGGGGGGDGGGGDWGGDSGCCGGSGDWGGNDGGGGTGCDWWTGKGCYNQQVPECTSFTASPTQVPYGGGSVTLSWVTANADSVSLSGFGVVANIGSKVVSVTGPVTYTLTLTNFTSGNTSCSVSITMEPPSSATCDSFYVDPTTLPSEGGDVTLNWETTNADSVSIDNGVGSVSDDGSVTVNNITQTTTFTLTAVGTDSTDTCTAKVTLEPDEPVAKCDFFTASPTSLPEGGGAVTLEWGTTNADSVSINNGVGTVAADGSTTVNVTDTTTFTLTAVGTDDSDTCTAKVTVDKDNDNLRCDYLRASDTKVRDGQTVTLTWETTGATSATLSPSIGSVGVDGSRDVVITRDITYTLTITDGDNTESCSVSIDEDSGGGGGSSSPRCELDASATKIDRGEEIKLEWETSRATDVKIVDNHGNVLLDTDDMDSDEKKDFLDGELTVKPSRDTRYTLTAERGSRDRDCRVEIEVDDDDDVVVYEYRDQQPLVAGVYLTQVPYTGFEAGPFLTMIFYGLLTLWALFVAYILVIRRDSILGFSLAGAHNHVSYSDASTDEYNDTPISQAESYIKSTLTDTVPANLPIADDTDPAMGYATTVASDEEVDVMTTLENRAHEQRVLLSSDAMRYFASVVAEGEYMSTLDAILAKAKTTFPSEDGWAVLNLGRMESLLSDVHTPAEEVLEATSATPMTASSLAEAIVTGNVVAAYEMIASRPMVALADAAADLDAVYRSRKGEEVSVSNMLTTSAAALTTEQLESAIKALTGAIDGTYTDEASAVKVAIMKAVKALS